MRNKYCFVNFYLSQEYLVILLFILHPLLVLLSPLLILLHRQPLLAVVLVPAGAAVHPHEGAVAGAVLPLPPHPERAVTRTPPGSGAGTGRVTGAGVQHLEHHQHQHGHHHQGRHACRQGDQEHHHH